MKTKKLVFGWILLSLLLVLIGVGYGYSRVVDLPSVIKAVAPKDYPPLASAAIVSGKVKIEVKIDKEGNVISAKTVEGHPLLRDISKAAALLWKFKGSEEGLEERTAQLTFTFIHWTERKENERGTTTFVPPYGVELVGRTMRIGVTRRTDAKDSAHIAVRSQRFPTTRVLYVQLT